MNSNNQNNFKSDEDIYNKLNKKYALKSWDEKDERPEFIKDWMRTKQFEWGWHD